MGKKILVMGLGAMLLTTTGWAADIEYAPVKERVGLASGAVLGGLTGGPLGLVIGAALGGWLGDEFDTQQHERDDYARRWSEAQQEVASLNALVTGGERELQQLTADYRQETASLRESIRDALDVQVLFKTGASAPSDETNVRLARLAALVARMDDLLIRIEGHADARGDAEFNEQLSAERAATVRDILIRAGVPASRIAIDARGEREAQAVDQDVDGMALERRVQLTLIPAGSAGRVARD
jgi:outer membrane protein OmpA-like peptidoglycan-associated protein